MTLRVVHGSGFGAGGGIGFKSFAYTGNAGSNTNGARSFSIAAGDADPNRWLILCCTQGGTGTLTTATIGGVSATKAHGLNGTNASATVFFAFVPTGTTATCSVGGSGGTNCHMALYSAILKGGSLTELSSYGAEAATISSTFTTAPLQSVIVGGTVRPASVGTSWSSTTGATVAEAYDVNHETSYFHSSGYATFTGIDANTENFRATGSNTAVGAMASFGVI